MKDPVPWYYLGVPSWNAELWGYQWEARTLLFASISVLGISFPFPALRTHSVFVSKYANVSWNQFGTAWMKSCCGILPIFVVSSHLAETPDAGSWRVMEFVCGLVSGAVSVGVGGRLWNQNRYTRLLAVPHLLSAGLGGCTAQDAVVWRVLHKDQWT